MDIEKDSNREAFEAIAENIRLLRGAKFKDGEYVALSLFDESSKELAAQLNYGWAMWLSSKNQAIPKGFVVVPKEPNKQFKNVLSHYLDELWMGEWGCDWDGFICVNGIDPNHVWKIVTDTKAMIEALEQSHE